MSPRSARAVVLGCPIDRLDMDQFVRRLDAYIAAGVPRQAVVVNAAKLVKMRHDPELRRCILQADLVGPDGVPVVWASRALGDSLPGRVNGTDLMIRLLELADRKRYRVFFFGATEAVVGQVVRLVGRRYPRLVVAGYRNGYFGKDEEPAIVEQIRRSHADILLVGFGTPAKEKWVNRYLHRMGVSVCHGVGGSFDVMVGKVRRAPMWMRRFGLEWLWRVIQEPGRMWKRYLTTNMVFIGLLILAKLQQLVFGKGGGGLLRAWHRTKTPPAAGTEETTPRAA